MVHNMTQVDYVCSTQRNIFASLALPRVDHLRHIQNRALENSCENFLPRNFKFTTDTRSGGKFDHENFNREKILSRNQQNRKTFTPQNFRLHGNNSYSQSLLEGQGQPHPECLANKGHHLARATLD